jgi:hypothetical protein
MAALPAGCINIILKTGHQYPCIRLHKVIHVRTIPHVTHDILRHSHKAITWVDVSIGPDSKSVPHAIDIRADRSPAGEHASAKIIDVHHLHILNVLEGFIEKVYEQLAILRRRESPLCRILRS